MTAGTDGAIVLDVGGTVLRIGRCDPAGRLRDVRRVPTDGLARFPDEPVPVLQHRVTEQIVREVEACRARPTWTADAAVAVAFAGPVTADGVVTAAPTVWGRTGPPLPLAGLLTERLGTPVLVVNDVTAAAWRYADRVADPFCLITVSSGVGNKVFHAGRVMVNDLGHGGELGHWRCDPSPDALPCECGGRGHLGAIASGRGAVALTRRMAAGDPAGYSASLLGQVAPDPARIDAESLAAAANTGDGFALAVLRTGLRHLASAITALFTTTGVHQFVIMGGFALGVGPLYQELLTDELIRQGCFGLSAERIHAMVILGQPDDDHGLAGLGRLVQARSAQRSAPAGIGGTESGNPQ